jgi:hypothetical protein
MANLLTAIVEWTSATSDSSDPVYTPTDVSALCRRTVRACCLHGMLASWQSA